MPTASEDMLKSPPSGLTLATGYVHPPCMKPTQSAPVFYQQPLRPRAGNSTLVAMPSPFTGTPLEWQTAIISRVSSLGPSASRASSRERSWSRFSSSSCLLTCQSEGVLLRESTRVDDTYIQLKPYSLQL